MYLAKKTKYECHESSRIIRARLYFSTWFMRVTCSGFLLGSAWLRDLSLRFPISRAPHTMRTVMDYAEVRGMYLDAFPGFPLVPNYCESKTMRRRFWAEYVCMGSRGLDFKIIYFTSLIIIYIRKFCKPKAVTTKEPQIMCKFHSLPSQLLKILSESNRVKKKTNHRIYSTL